MMAINECDLPAGMQATSWAITELSCLATQKALTDHGISMVVGRDCAVTKMVIDGIFCADQVSEDLRITAPDGGIVYHKNTKNAPP